MPMDAQLILHVCLSSIVLPDAGPSRSPYECFSPQFADHPIYSSYGELVVSLVAKASK